MGMPVRWSGVAAVVAIHLLLLLMFWQSDKIRSKPLDSPAMTVISLARPKIIAAPPRAMPLPSSGPTAITLPPPRFTIAPSEPPPNPDAITVPKGRTFDLTIHKDGPSSIEQMFPDAEARRKQFMREQDRANELANEKPPPISSDDCSVSTASSRDLSAPSNIGAGFDHTPDLVCTPHLSLKALKRRNDLLSPH